MKYKGIELVEVTESQIFEKPEKMLVRKWEDTEWHSPTREYLGLED